MCATIEFNGLLEFMKRIPAVENSIYTGIYEDGKWWVKFSIDIKNDIAWNIVQEFAHVANYLSVNERLPTVFYPVSAPPYLNGGPSDYLYWIVETNQIEFSPSDFKDWLEGRLPNPVEDISEWKSDE